MSEGPIKINGKEIAKEGQNVADVFVGKDEELGDTFATVRNHEAGGRAKVTVSNDISSETRNIRSGDTIRTNDTLVTHDIE